MTDDSRPISSNLKNPRGERRCHVGNDANGNVFEPFVRAAWADAEIERLQKSIDRCGTEEGVCYAVELERKDKEIERLRRLENFAKTIYDTFIRTEEQGYRTRDRQYVIDMLKPVLSGDYSATETSPSGWQPIGTEPTDGSEFIVFHKLAGVCACFRTGPTSNWYCMDGWNTYTQADGSQRPGLTSFVDPPECWMPMPKPPGSPVETKPESHYCIDCNDAHDPRTCGALEPPEKASAECTCVVEGQYTACPVHEERCPNGDPCTSPAACFSAQDCLARLAQTLTPNGLANATISNKGEQCE